MYRNDPAPMLFGCTDLPYVSYGRSAPTQTNMASTFRVALVLLCAVAAFVAAADTGANPNDGTTSFPLLSTAGARPHSFPGQAFVLTVFAFADAPAPGPETATNAPPSTTGAFAFVFVTREPPPPIGSPGLPTRLVARA